ncbi:hypothetical protein AK812_SmicGene12146, partial [Symbiodinium microadriaticum]
ARDVDRFAVYLLAKGLGILIQRNLANSSLCYLLNKALLLW